MNLYYDLDIEKTICPRCGSKINYTIKTKETEFCSNCVSEKEMILMKMNGGE